jgi:uncharacterized protein YgiM (DUF1202 family)
MKKIFLLLFFMLIGGGLLMAQKTMYVSSSNGVNLREGAGVSHKVIATIPNGGKVQVVDTNGDWSQVKYEGKTGYVSSQFLKDDKPNNQSSSKSSRTTQNNSASSRKQTGTSNSAGPGLGIGIRLGDPLGLTVKKYTSGGNAWEFNLGTTGYYGFNYRNYFYDRYKNSDYEYLNYNGRRAVSLQAHYLFQKDFPNSDGLQWYWGLGPQIRFMTHYYSYRFRNYFGPGPGDFVWMYDHKRATHLDLNVDIVFGLEYHFPKAPFSVFGDVNLSIEILDDPFLLFVQGGLGIRYNIR